MDNTTNSEQPEARRSLHADVRCVGRGAADGCGYKGGQSGCACPKCGGMLLSKPARTDAIRLAATWLNEEASNVKTVATEGAGESPTEAAQPSSQK